MNQKQLNVLLWRICSCFSSISEVYFKLEMLRSWSGKANQSISNFEKIRTVGKGRCKTHAPPGHTVISIGMFSFTSISAYKIRKIQGGMQDSRNVKESQEALFALWENIAVSTLHRLT